MDYMHHALLGIVDAMVSKTRYNFILLWLILYSRGVDHPEIHHPDSSEEGEEYSQQRTLSSVSASAAETCLTQGHALPRQLAPRPNTFCSGAPCKGWPRFHGACITIWLLSLTKCASSPSPLRVLILISIINISYPKLHFSICFQRIQPEQWVRDESNQWWHKEMWNCYGGKCPKGKFTGFLFPALYLKIVPLSPTWMVVEMWDSSPFFRLQAPL